MKTTKKAAAPAPAMKTMNAMKVSRSSLWPKCVTPVHLDPSRKPLPCSEMLPASVNGFCLGAITRLRSSVDYNVQNLGSKPGCGITMCMCASEHARKHARSVALCGSLLLFVALRGSLLLAVALCCSLLFCVALSIAFCGYLLLSSGLCCSLLLSVAMCSSPLVLLCFCLGD